MWYSESFEAGSLNELARLHGRSHFMRRLPGEPKIKNIFFLSKDKEEVPATQAVLNTCLEMALDWSENYTNNAKEDEAYRKECRSLIYDGV